MKYEKIYGIILAYSVISIVIFALVVPMRGLRKNMLDSQIVSSLSAVQIATESYISEKGEVPKNVGDLTFETDSKPSSKTLKRISIKEDGGGYQLCATFYTDTKKDTQESTSNVGNLIDMAKSFTSSYDNYGNYNVHSAGNYCFANVDPYSSDMPTDDYSNDTNYNNYGSGTNYYSTSLTTGSEKSGRDTKRQTDIKSMHSQLEAYFAQNGGGYPALADFNTPSWRVTNMKGLDDVSLCDPSALSQTRCVLVSAPQSKAYSYQTWEDDGTVCTSKSGQDCPKYTLTATLESTINGSSTYVKKSLN